MIVNIETASIAGDDINRATGLTREQITSRSRKIELVYARMIVVYYLYKSTNGMNITRKNEIIGEIINRDRNTVHYITSKMNFELEHNSVFRYQFDKVSAYLNL